VVVVVLVVVAAMTATTVTITDEAAAAPTPIGSCTTITSSGSYVLTANVATNATNCIEIRASNVTLDGAGHEVRNTGSGDSAVVANTTRRLVNVTVRNITVVNWDRAVRFVEVDGGLVEGVESYDSRVGVWLGATRHVEVQESYVNNSTDVGVGLTPSASGTRPRNNTVVDVQVELSGIGLGVRGGVDNKFLFSERYGNRYAGVMLETYNGLNTTHTVIRNNTIVRNGNGTLSFGSSAAVVRDTEFRTNFVAHNRVDGVRLEYGTHGTVLDTNNVSFNDRGMVFLDTADTRVVDSEAKENTDWTVVTHGAVNVTVQRLDIGNSTRPTTVSFQPHDVALGTVSNPPSDPAGYRNVSHYVRVDNTSASASLDLRVFYTQADINRTGVNESSLELWRYAGSWSSISGSGVNTTANYVYGGTSTFAPGAEIIAPLGRT
jgi:hypothetical protein